MLGDFAIHVENTLFKYGKNIIGNELPQGRIANMAIELYVQLAVLSRTTKILEDKEIPAEKKDYVLNLAKYSLRESRHKFQSNSKSMNKNYDEVTKQLSKSVCDNLGYGLDILKF